MSYTQEEHFSEDRRYRARIVPDDQPPCPTEWDNLGEIAYLASSRDLLGTEPVSRERMDEIARLIRKGEYVGVPVYAYVHSGVVLRAGTGPKGFDSGASGFAYCTAEKAKAEFAGSRTWRAAARKCLAAQVAEYSQYLEGDVWGVIVERVTKNGTVVGDPVDTLWGLYGLDYAREEALNMLRP